MAALQVAVLTSGLATLVLAGLAFTISWLWWRDALPARTSFGIWEGLPFLVIGVLLLDAAVNLFMLRRLGIFLALAGSLGALTHGIYRSIISLAYIPGPASNTPWISSAPGALITLLAGAVVLPLSIWAYRPFRRLAWPSLDGRVP